jgi:hypothetical protein
MDRFFQLITLLAFILGYAWYQVPQSTIPHRHRPTQIHPIEAMKAIYDAAGTPSRGNALGVHSIERGAWMREVTMYVKAIFVVDDGSIRQEERMSVNPTERRIESIR